MKKHAVPITICTTCCHTYLPDSPLLLFQRFIPLAFPLLHKKMAQPARHLLRLLRCILHILVKAVRIVGHTTDSHNGASLWLHRILFSKGKLLCLDQN